MFIVWNCEVSSDSKHFNFNFVLSFFNKVGIVLGQNYNSFYLCLMIVLKLLSVF